MKPKDYKATNETILASTNKLILQKKYPDMEVDVLMSSLKVLFWNVILRQAFNGDLQKTIDFLEEKNKYMHSWKLVRNQQSKK